MGDGFAGEGTDGGEGVRGGLKGLRREELDGDCAGVLDGVFGHEGADSLGDGEDELVSFFGGGVIEIGRVDGVGGAEDGGSRVAGAAGEPLPEFFCEEGHEGVDEFEASFESGV